MSETSMSVDLSTLKVGDKFIRRNGIIDFVREIEFTDHVFFKIKLNGVHYGVNGRYDSKVQGNSDIVEIIPQVTTPAQSAPISGVKLDNGKPDYSLLTRAMMEPMVKALMYGEGKYSRGNFRGGFVNTRLTAAALRHIMAWQDSEDNDPESGVTHLGHAMAALAMLLDNEKEGVSSEGRYPTDK